jgi:Putative lumazine-binding
MFEKDVIEIQAVIARYFEGMFHGDVKKLGSAFHEQCMLFGDINGQPYFKTLPEYLEGVKNRKSPKEIGEDFKMKVLGIELTNSVAFVKLHVPMLGFNYYDFISMHKLNGQWLIVNKLFTNVQS